MKKCVETRTT